MKALDLAIEIETEHTAAGAYLQHHLAAIEHNHLKFIVLEHAGFDCTFKAVRRMCQSDICCTALNAPIQADTLSRRDRASTRPH
jgi:hypothetical protein